MSRITLIFLFVLAVMQGYGQNIVQNGSFEFYSTCPSNYAQLNFCTGWGSYSMATPDYYHSCCTATNSFSVPSNTAGIQSAAHGNAYAGVINYGVGSTSNYREYLHQQISALIPGGTYEMSISVSLAEDAMYADDGFEVYFFDAAPSFINNNNIVPVTPQVSYSNYGIISSKTNWTRLIDTFVADSAFDNIVIGNFRPNSAISTTFFPLSFDPYSYYYVDSIVLKLIRGVQLNYTNSSLCAGDTIYVPYTVNAGGYLPGNIFTLQLSGPTGSFLTPINIGSLSSSTSGSVKGVIPSTILPGSGYRLRIMTSNPLDSSANNGVNIQIKPLPATITATTNAPLCEGTTLNLLSSASTTGSTYSWVGPLSFTAAIQNPSVLNPGINRSGDYVVTATLNGCESKDTLTILVKPVPVVSSAGNNSPLCEGSNLSLTTSSIAGTSFSWTGPSYSSTAQNPVINNASTSNQGTYTVTTSLNGCTSSPASTNVVVNIIPATPTANSNSPVCLNGQLNLFANSGTPGVSYTWSGPSFTSNAQNPVISTANLGNMGTYTVTATKDNCNSASASANVLVLYTSSSVDVYPLPNDSICVGGSINFVAVSSNGGTNPQFQWLKNGFIIGGANNISYSTSGMVTGDKFSVIMTPSTNCGQPDTSADVTVTLLPYVTSTVSITASPGTLISPWQTITFNTTVINGGKSPTFQWKRNGQDIVGAVNDTWGAYTLSNNDTIWVEMYSSELCPSPAVALSNKIIVAVKTGIDEVKNKNGFSIYPNPNKGQFAIQGDFAKAMRLEIRNTIGQLVYKQTLSSSSNRKDVVLNTKLPAGVYIINLQGEGGNEKLRIVIE